MAEIAGPVEVTETIEAQESEGSDTASLASNQIDDSDLALSGIALLLNNEWDEAKAFFSKHRDESPLMCSGNSLVDFIQAMMSFEEEKRAEAMKSLRETEKRCEATGGFVKVIKRKFKKNSSQSDEFMMSNFSKSVNLEDRLQRQIVQADAIVYQAVLTFIEQDISSYVKGGWLMRKAWKIYEKTHKETKNLYESLKGQSQNGPAVALEGSDMMDNNENDISADVAERLFGAVNFGYGIFQLCLSMIPPNLLKVIQFLGFHGDTNTGLEALNFSSHSRDMRAPLATLGLLWYHTVIRPFFALDGNTVDAGVEDALKIIQRCEKQYPKSSLFLFFKGRTQRLQSQLDASLATYRLALDGCKNQREMQLICLHELGWLNMMKMNWRDALTSFTRLKDESRWSKSYYAYLTGLSLAILGDLKGAELQFKDVSKLIRNKNNQIEAFVLKRTERFKKIPLSPEYATLLGCEVLYLWNAFPNCTKEALDTMLTECGKQTNKKVFHLQSLVEGAIYRELGQREMAAQCFEEAVARHSGMKDDYHVAAYALYELGIMMAKEPATHDKGKKLLNQAKDGFKEYDFDRRLNVRIHAALKRLNNEGTPI